MTRGEKLYEGKAKIVYTTDDPDVYIQDFKDSATAFDGKKKGTIGEKGRMNNAISSRLFELLEDSGVPTHFLGREGETGMRIRRLDMFQVEFVVRNVAAGSLSKRIGYPEGTALKNPPIVEYYYKDDALGDPLLCMGHLDELQVISPEDLAEATVLAKEVNTVLTAFFLDRDLTLVDFKLEFGKDAAGTIRLGDEISPDTCRLW
ncbi:MAG TPA: phosphoribosylaminoimidazolesuccinocarboxamide synthase, partial [Thermoleophilia bacterium]|nr:phosphoribosylaminoimidazolesuccinocarboxamide synthase [Thermoleophilia bacterium]